MCIYICIYIYLVCRSYSKVVSSTKDQELLPNRFPNCGQIVLLLLANPSDVHRAKSFPWFSFPLCGYQIFQMFKTLQYRYHIQCWNQSLKPIISPYVVRLIHPFISMMKNCVQSYQIPPLRFPTICLLSSHVSGTKITRSGKYFLVLQEPERSNYQSGVVNLTISCATMDNENLPSYMTL